MTEFWAVATLLAAGDLATIASAVADWVRPGRHRRVVAHASIALRAS